MGEVWISLSAIEIEIRDHYTNSVFRRSSLARFELFEEPRTGLNVGSLQALRKVFGLGLTADSRLLEALLLLLLLNGGGLFDRLAASPSPEKHMGEAVSDGRPDGDGTGRGRHLGQHPRPVARLRRRRLVRDGGRLRRVRRVGWVRSGGRVRTPRLRGRVRSRSGSGTTGAPGLPWHDETREVWFGNKV